ncbi:hypothetical protein ACVIGB_001144 [Bradyrhizobium sp. USDA 4341]
MTDRSCEWAQKAIATFKKHADAGVAPALCAERSLEIHIKSAGMEGDREIQVWHYICSLAAYSDSQGFFRDQVFGPKQNGGPLVHKVASGLRDHCASQGINYDDLYQEVCAHLDTEPPPSPSL